SPSRRPPGVTETTAGFEETNVAFVVTSSERSLVPPAASIDVTSSWACSKFRSNAILAGGTFKASANASRDRRIEAAAIAARTAGRMRKHQHREEFTIVLRKSGRLNGRENSGGKVRVFVTKPATGLSACSCKGKASTILIMTYRRDRCYP